MTVTYSLSNIHFHTKSEHTVDGKQYAIEMHMVHSIDEEYKNLTTYEKLVIGVFFVNEEGKENPLLKAFKLDSLRVASFNYPLDH
jgi:carbonic anhydrase